MRVLVFDNYDSFTYNLVHLVEKITHTRVDVFRNDEMHLDEIDRYDKVILSPGPGVPVEAGLLIPLIETYASRKSILGVCLGHQAIGEVFGAVLRNLDDVYHGVTTSVHLHESSSKLFAGLEAPFIAGQYHSWVVEETGFPDTLEITCKDENGLIMGLKHKQYGVEGLQFHPESVLTPLGEKILYNWLVQE